MKTMILRLRQLFCFHRWINTAGAKTSLYSDNVVWTYPVSFYCVKCRKLEVI